MFMELQQGVMIKMKMNKKIIFLMIALLLIGSLVFVTAKPKIKLVPFFSHCSCSYICVPKGEVMFDCDRECPVVSRDGSKIKIKKIKCKG